MFSEFFDQTIEDIDLEKFFPSELFDQEVKVLEDFISNRLNTSIISNLDKISQLIILKNELKGIKSVRKNVIIDRLTEVVDAIIIEIDILEKSGNQLSVSDAYFYEEFLLLIKNINYQVSVDLVDYLMIGDNLINAISLTPERFTYKMSDLFIQLSVFHTVSARIFAIENVVNRQLLEKTLSSNIILFDDQDEEQKENQLREWDAIKAKHDHRAPDILRKLEEFWPHKSKNITEARGKVVQWYLDTYDKPIDEKIFVTMKRKGKRGKFRKTHFHAFRNLG